MTSSRTIHTLVAASVIIGAGFTLAPGVPAAANPVVENLLISHDGTTFTPGSDVDLFSDIGRPVPGSEIIERIWLRNTSADSGLVQVELVEVTANDLDLARATEVDFTDADGQSVGDVTLEQALVAGPCTVGTRDILIEPGSTIHLDVALGVDEALGSQPGDTGRDGALASVGFQLRATLSDAAVGPVEVPGCPPGDGGPDDGSPGNGQGPGDGQGPGAGTGPGSGQGSGQGSEGGTAGDGSRAGNLPFTGTTLTGIAFLAVTAVIGIGFGAVLYRRRGAE